MTVLEVQSSATMCCFKITGAVSALAALAAPGIPQLCERLSAAPAYLVPEVCRFRRVFPLGEAAYEVVVSSKCYRAELEARHAERLATLAAKRAGTAIATKKPAPPKLRRAVQ